VCYYISPPYYVVFCKLRGGLPSYSIFNHQFVEPETPASDAGVCRQCRPGAADANSISFGTDKDNTVLWDFMLTVATGSLPNVPVQPLRDGTQTIRLARQYQSSFPSLNEKMAEVRPEKAGII
jgi:hypothetical protein